MLVRRKEGSQKIPPRIHWGEIIRRHLNAYAQLAARDRGLHASSEMEGRVQQLKSTLWEKIS